MVRSKLIAMLITLAATLCICVGTLYFIRQYTDEAERLCAHAVTQFDAGQTSDALETLTILANTWKNRAGFLETVTSHTDLQRVTEQIIDAKISLEQGDADGFQRQARLLDYAIRHISDQERLRLSNLF